MKQHPISNDKKLHTFYVKRKKPPNTIGTFFFDYLNGCNIHGLNYLVKEELTPIEKCFWTIILIISLYFCIQLGLGSVDRYYNRSTIISIERNYYYWNTTMPSLTICPWARLDRELYNKYSREKNLNETESKMMFNFLENLANTTYSNVRQIPVNVEIDQILDQLNIKPDDYMELIYSLTGDKTLKFVKDISNPVNKIRAMSGDFIISIHQILTEYGLCYMANSYLDQKYSSSFMIKGHLATTDIENSPLYIKTKMCGYFDDENNYNILGLDTSPANIYLHSSYEVMKTDSNLGFIAKSLQLKVESKETVADDNFKNDVSIERRRCRFQHENNLTHFPIYTQNLCYQECRLNLVYKTCKCIPHFYPKAPKNPKTICDYRLLRDCLSENEDLFIKLYGIEEDGSKYFVKCYCLQNCEYASPNILDKYAIDNTNTLFGGNGLLLDMSNIPKVRAKRQNIFTFSDLLVSLGSTAGLFLGFSVLCLVEIVYHITLKIMFTSLKEHRTNNNPII